MYTQKCVNVIQETKRLAISWNFGEKWAGTGLRFLYI